MYLSIVGSEAKCNFLDWILAVTHVKPRPRGEVDAHADGEGKEKSKFKANNLSGVYAASSPGRRAFGFERLL